jgi:hypothetical protein
VSDEQADPVEGLFSPLARRMAVAAASPSDLGPWQIIQIIFSPLLGIEPLLPAAWREVLSQERYRNQELDVGRLLGIVLYWEPFKSGPASRQPGDPIPISDLPELSAADWYRAPVLHAMLESFLPTIPVEGRQLYAPALEDLAWRAKQSRKLEIMGIGFNRNGMLCIRTGKRGRRREVLDETIRQLADYLESFYRAGSQDGTENPKPLREDIAAFLLPVYGKVDDSKIRNALRHR